MTFVFPVLLGSLALIGIPVLIHLIMRRKPKIEMFPAFRFLLQRQRINVRKLRLRHLLLLALRILLVACIGLALARPQVFFQSLSLRGDRPIAVVMIFDTSFTMQYKGNNDIPRLEQAKEQALELIKQLPQGSQVAILDTAESAAAGRTQWYQSMNEARDRIAGLQWKPANSPVSQRLENAYRMLADLANSKDDEHGRHLPRLILIFSDRTRSSWDTFGDMDLPQTGAQAGSARPFSKFRRLVQAADQVPPILSGLHQAREYVPNLIDQLGELREKLPPEAGKDYPQQELLGSLTQMSEALPRVTADDLVAGSEFIKTIDNVRRQTREMILALSPMKDPDPSKEYQEKLLVSLNSILKDLAGARAFFIDLGIDTPFDLALLDLALPSIDGRPRQVFSKNEKFQLRAHVLATGKDADTTLALQVGKKTFPAAHIKFKAGQVQVVPFEIDCNEFGVGQHSAELKLATDDLLPGNNVRYATFAVRPARRVLILSDEPDKARELFFALSVNGFVPEIARPQDRQTTALVDYQAVFLDSLRNPGPALWAALEEYVMKGGGVAVIPGGAEMNLETYNQGPAQRLLPGTWQKLIMQTDKSAAWNLSQGQAWVFQHPLLRPFLKWTNKDLKIDFILLPRTARQYWEVAPKFKESVLVKYDDYDDDRARPALLERTWPLQERPGKVLMFTTPLDPRTPPWNNYLEATMSFYPVLIDLCAKYLANDAETAQLNFVCGQGDAPTVHLPLTPRYPAYLLQGPDIREEVRVPDGSSEVAIKQAVFPGNYSLHSLPPNEGKFTARFSLNLPPEESNLSRLPVEDLEAVLGKGSVLAGQETTSLHDIMQGQWSEPVEMLPSLMVLILLALALENLLANRFYKKVE